ncbi:hypothetical protein [Chamaesiphon minutus]|uniref:Uncharacterized protein n=1 Tax=Chamaesiphon minutus (strain ATCC 27169 / PCC 6605) TaxID=1173020 RepID=K9UK16_CHAP6|nr:hypothetical protein [Chamaesiphon minutus]AFY94766.1 hypothetical protein Cha6605_3795 [Chamaesiphon minutus PCC 6605]
MEDKFYNLDLNKIAFLSKEVIINIPSNDIIFLCNTGLPKLVESLEWAFDLSQVKKYACIDSKQDCTEYINEEDEKNNLEFIYKIGKHVAMGMFISIQESDGGIYLAENPIYKDREKFLQKTTYINSDIEGFAKCLKIYDIFFVSNKDIMDDCYIKTEEERHSILLKLEVDLKNVDVTIVGSSPGKLDYDGLWTYLIEEMYDIFDIDSYEEEGSE